MHFVKEANIERLHIVCSRLLEVPQPLWLLVIAPRDSALENKTISIWKRQSYEDNKMVHNCQGLEKEGRIDG